MGDHRENGGILMSWLLFSEQFTHKFSSPRKGAGQPASPLRVSQAGALPCEEEEDAISGTRQGGRAPVTPRGRGRRGRPPSRTTGTRYPGKRRL